MFCFTKPFKALYSSLSSPSTAVTADFSVSPVKPTPLAPTLTELCLSYPWKGHLKCGISILSNPMLQNMWSPPGRPIRAPCWFSSSQVHSPEGYRRLKQSSERFLQWHISLYFLREPCVIRKLRWDGSCALTISLSLPERDFCSGFI